MKRLVPFALMLLLGGCWASAGPHDVAAARVRTIAILPVLNMTEAQVSSTFVSDALAHALTAKKYGVVSTAEVARELNMGDGAAAYGELVDRLDTDREVPDALFDRLAQDLQADSLFQETIVNLHEIQEERPVVSPQGISYFATVPVSVVQVRGQLYGTNAHAMIWHARYTDQRMIGASESRMSSAALAAIASDGLLNTFPVNTWAPVLPSASPTASETVPVQPSTATPPSPSPIGQPAR
ncbi:MAG TPA: hypothetical protein V6D47_05345 [Oscillatoriaceae cyanobacterium]